MCHKRVWTTQQVQILVLALALALALLKLLKLIVIPRVLLPRGLVSSLLVQEVKQVQEAHLHSLSTILLLTLVNSSNNNNSLKHNLWSPISSTTSAGNSLIRVSSQIQPTQQFRTWQCQDWLKLSMTCLWPRDTSVQYLEASWVLLNHNIAAKSPCPCGSTLHPNPNNPNNPNSLNNLHANVMFPSLILLICKRVWTS